ncbi:Hypothetical predicted protein [Lecanosticta acicola]|uniref:Uncharacterized protein n=1 Tax=Lecanosticta acicola TaxID=111012 RepID=A0AAI9EBV4_9PEZI|nr:Hypothetical predicted protein [Lecanosticta acicola]
MIRSDTPYEMIIIGCRAPQKGEEAIKSPKQESPQMTSTLTVVQVDLKSNSSISAARECITSRYPEIDGLIKQDSTVNSKPARWGIRGI